MNEEKKGWMDRYTFLTIFSVVAIAFGFLYIWFLPTILETSVHEAEITIEHLWEGNEGDYYFADTDGYIYLIGCEGIMMYKDIPKVRFNQLKKGNKYEIEWIITHREQFFTRVSIRENEVNHPSLNPNRF